MDLTNINDIKALLARHGFRFSKSMGQNFLTAAWVPEDIADSAGIDKDTGVLEIGPGIGCLTEQLSMRAGKVVSVEIDKALKPVLRETLGGCENVEIVFDDVLKVDIPSLLDEKMPGMRHVVCANLPYNVTGPVISKLLESGCFDCVTVMIQREVARRARNGRLRRVHGVCKLVCTARASFRCAARLLHSSAQGDLERDTPDKARRAPGRGKKRGNVHARCEGGICSAAQDFAERFKCRIWRNEQGNRRKMPYR